MPRTQIQSDKISKPNGHFAQATMVEARGRLSLPLPGGRRLIRVKNKARIEP